MSRGAKVGGLVVSFIRLLRAISALPRLRATKSLFHGKRASKEMSYWDGRQEAISRLQALLAWPTTREHGSGRQITQEKVNAPARTNLGFSERERISQVFQSGILSAGLTRQQQLSADAASWSRCRLRSGPDMDLFRCLTKCAWVAI